ncbi:MAG: hypothetical protein ACJAVA_000171 [Flavobacteriaceae bacterium]|jgi:hypothetical protein
MTDGHKLFLTVGYSFDYTKSHFHHIAAFDCISQFFEHRNNIKGYIDDEKGPRVEEGSDLAIFYDEMYESFDNGDIGSFVKNKLLEYEMYEVLQQLNEPLYGKALELKKELEIPNNN